MSEQFKWIGFYTEFATKLLEYKDDRKTLIQKLMNVYAYSLALLDYRYESLVAPH